MPNEVPEPRAPLVGDAEAGPEVREAFARLTGTRGAVADVFRSLAHSPGALSSVSGVGEHIRYHSSLDPILRELAILTVARLRRCQYEWAQHVPIAEKLGVDAEILDKVGTPEIELEPEPLGPALRFSRTLVESGEVDDEAFRRVQVLLGNQGLVDLIVLVGYYRLLADVINTFEIVPDEIQ